MDYASVVRTFVIETFLFGDSDALRDDTSFMESGIVDSTGMLEIISFLEETCHVEIRPEEMVPENLDSVEKVTRFLNGKRPVNQG